MLFRNTELHSMALLSPQLWMDLLLRAHKLHVVLGVSSHYPPPVQIKAKPGKETYHFKCSRSGFTSRTYPNYNSLSRVSSHPTETPVMHAEPSLVCITWQMHPTSTNLSFVMWRIAHQLPFGILHSELKLAYTARYWMLHLTLAHHFLLCRQK